MRIKIKINKTFVKLDKSLMEKESLTYNLFQKYNCDCSIIHIPIIHSKWFSYTNDTKDLIEGLLENKYYYTEVYKRQNKHIHYNAIMILRVVEQYLLTDYFTRMLENDCYYRELARKTNSLRY